MPVQLNTRYQLTKPEAGIQSFDLIVTITSATDMPEEVFIFQRGVAPAASVDEAPTDTFVCIADPVDLEEFPVNSPDLLNEIPYYRMSTVTLRYRSMSELEEARDMIAADLDALVKSLKVSNTLTIFLETGYVG